MVVTTGLAGAPDGPEGRRSELEGFAAQPAGWEGPAFNVEPIRYLTLGGAMDAATMPGPQHMLALERANRVRLARAALKRKVAAGKAEAAEVILSCPWETESMSISELLMSQKRWGRTRCRKFLQSIGMSENKTVGTLTERQRVTLAALLTAKAQSSRAQAQRAVA
jgi:hypothetical protein